jgi:hypothetical protein
MRIGLDDVAHDKQWWWAPWGRVLLGKYRLDVPRDRGDGSE